MEFSVLGPVRVTSTGREIPVPGRKQRTMLAALLLAGGRPLSDDRLTAVMWGGRAPATVGAQLCTYASRLRTRLGPAAELRRVGSSYRLGVIDGFVDAAEFDRLARAGHEALRAGRPEVAAPLLRSALGLWRGPALDGVTQQLRDAEVPQLDEARTSALESRIEAELALGEHRGLVPELTGLVARYPLRERLRAQWMTALYRCERQAEALAAYQEGRRILVEELGVDPGPALTAAHHAVLQGRLGLNAV
ncbi:AfsR/SARP family transcriptional regulator [Streptomyces sp. NBC_01716]|uniref:AfsR/SARP family transcriptional regulator n=1 Tax=Streptomyces sp. NBC_01716 TaxID=2975917 RepID=UPI002E364377|nr:AfsR/SARP family transcriptional regulator [Streptomyces sp. NBC_01716]